MTLRSFLPLLVAQHLVFTGALAADESLQSRRYDYPGFLVSEDYRLMGECNVHWPTLPFRGSYRWLSQNERAWLTRWYETIPEGDTPPYPKDGIGEIIDRVGHAAAARGETFTGSATVFVEIDSTGRAVDASSNKGSDTNVARMIGSAVSFLEFEPASCGGKPCKMVLPVQLTVSCKGQQEKRHRGTTYLNISL